MIKYGENILLQKFKILHNLNKILNYDFRL